MSNWPGEQLFLSDELSFIEHSLGRTDCPELIHEALFEELTKLFNVDLGVKKGCMVVVLLVVLVVVVCVCVWCEPVFWSLLSPLRW